MPLASFNILTNSPLSFLTRSSTLSEPSLQHEARRSMLSTVATLAGFSSPFPLPDGLVPDVARLSLATGAILIGDAKHSELARGTATLGRLE